MRTDDLIAMLSHDEGPVNRRHLRATLAVVLSAGIVASGLLMVMTLGIRPDLATMMHFPMFWVKIAFPTLLALAALGIYWRSAHPGRRLGRATLGVAIPVVAMASFAMLVLIQADPGNREVLLFGTTWRTCPFNIALLAVPVFVGSLMFMRQLAPTRPRLAGAACGLLAGTTAAVVYALHCPEIAAPFIAVWYLLGMLLPAAIGALSGERLLHW